MVNIKIAFRATSNMQSCKILASQKRCNHAKEKLFES